MFHPLIKPLTTYVYTTDTEKSETVSSADEERLPPGGFSLRHGFSEWFAKKNTAKFDMEDERQVYNAKQPSSSPILTCGTSLAPTCIEDTSRGKENENKKTSIYQVLRYIRSTFDNEVVLDQVPLAAAGNPGAWHAWRTHRAKVPKNSTYKIGDSIVELKASFNLGPIKDRGGNTLTNTIRQDIPKTLPSHISTSTSTEWNWDGVWKIRVKKCVDASISESVLYGKDSGDDLIRFLNLESTQIDALQENIRRSLDIVEPTRRNII